MAKIERIIARQILDSRDTPTVEAEVFLDNGKSGKASVPSGASTGEHEAFELRDEDPNEYGGKSVHRAVNNIEGPIANTLLGMEITEQKEIDRAMVELDGTDNKSKLGANAILAVSLAAAKAGAASQGLELFEYLGQKRGKFLMPRAMFNILNGGRHAKGSSDLQEYMIIPLLTQSFAKRLEVASEIFASLKKILEEKGLPTTLGDEGGFAPPVTSNTESLDMIMQAAGNAGFEPGIDFGLGIDLAASEFYKDGKYILLKDKKELDQNGMIKYCQELVEKYPIISLEDPLEQEDFEGFAKITNILGSKVQIVGDDLYTTNTHRIKTGIEKHSTNAVLIKVNQIGTLTEAIEAMEMAFAANMKCIVSHRSGETEDTFIADLSVAMGADQVKMGSVSRSERVAKYNRLLEIEDLIKNTSDKRY